MTRHVGMKGAMGSQYLLECECGRTLHIGGRQAGQSLQCTCGQTVRVPPLSHLRRLPSAELDDLRRGPSWTQVQGIAFVAGAVVTAVAVGVFLYFLSQRFRLDEAATPLDRFLEREDISSLCVDDAWAGWWAYRYYGLGWDHTPPYLVARRRATTLNVYLAIAGATAAAGAVLITVALFHLKPTRRASTKAG